jgi:uncharacterized protein YcnI
VRRGLAAAALAAGTLLAATGTASAHVRVHPDATASGGYAQLTFRVPNESATAGTVKLEVILPQDHPFTSVSTTPVPGWTATVTEAPLPSPADVGGATITKAPRTGTWAARKGTQIGPGEYEDFPISVGPLPAPGVLVLPATQTYSDGTVVRWENRQATGEVEPEHPAPAFTVTAAEGHGHGTEPATPSDSDTAATATPDGTARWLGGAALVVSVLAAVGVLVEMRRRRYGGAGVPTPSEGAR